MQLVGAGGRISVSPPSTPGIRYMKVGIEGRTVFLALGYVEPAPIPALGFVDVWYSSKGEVLKLWNGRVIATAGLSTDWREVRLLHLPDWHSARSHPLRYERVRDEMPGYRFGIEETLELRAIPTPGKNSLSGNLNGTVYWFEESVIDGLGHRPPLPPSRFAVSIAEGKETVVYSEQCLSATACLTLQPWSVSP